MMEKSVKLFLAVLTASAAFCLSGAEELPVFEKIKITVTLQDPPRVKLSSNANSGTGKLLQTNSKWGVIGVAFSPGLQMNKTGIKKSTGTWLDDVTMALQVILVDPDMKKMGGYALFDGRCDFWTIALDNRKHSAYMFIAPQIIERYLPSRRTSGTVRTAQVRDFKVRAIFFHKTYGVIGEAYYGFAGSVLKQHRKEFSRMKERIGARNTLNGALLTRIRTPWGLGDMGKYDLVKPDVILPALNEEALEKAAQEADEKDRKKAEQSKLEHTSSSKKKKQ